MINLELILDYDICCIFIQICKRKVDWSFINNLLIND